MTGPPPAALLRRWAREQARLKGGVVAEDTEEWQKEPSFAGLERVGGVDLSYVKGDDSRACASLVVLSYPGLEVLYEDCQMVAVSAPYVAGFLAFREVPFLVEAVQRLQQEEPRLKPQVLLVDGNGLLHHRGFGVACHLGVLTDLPCIGVAKNLLQVDGLARDELHREQIRSLQRGGDTFPLTGTSGNVLGMALRSCNSSKPLYISVGHRVCLETAVRLVQSCCRYRIPEPIRQATSVMLMLIQRSWKRSFPGALSLAQTAVLLLWAFPRYCTPQGTAGSGTAGSQLTLDRGSIFGNRCVHQ
ncbi:endonuclease V isoform X1 [Cygnus olor]|uniref:endonuclease V isoform X1 n=1 Tax=Cygnus olor TaxID=8869 RepID=UPI001ADDFFB3|nr:endonuclease V isoform X1 [Cygnus olor]